MQLRPLYHVPGKKATFLLQEEGYDEVMVRDDAFYKKLRNVLGERPLNLVMECISGSILKQSRKAVTPMGRMVVYGNARFSPYGNKPNYQKLIWKYLKQPKIDTLRLPTPHIALT